MIAIYYKVDKERHKINKFKISGGESDAFLRTIKNLGIDVILKVTLDNISKIHFIPRKFILKSKITLYRARNCFVPGKDVNAKTKLKDLNETKKDAKELFRNKVSKVLKIKINGTS